MAGTGAGLEGVVATSSKICYIDGEQGVLSYFGYNIHTLADNATFEEVIYLLWNGKLPNQKELTELKASLVAERELPEQVTDFLEECSARCSTHGRSAHGGFHAEPLRPAGERQLSGGERQERR